MIVDLPKWSVANGYSGAAQTVAYKVANSSVDTSFEEVLQAVVALIASINKQIQALQKLILKR
jgi:glutaredoxin 2